MALETTFAPDPTAVAKLAQRTPIASILRSADWERMPIALRERAQFSAGVEDIRVMATIQDKILKRVAMQRESVARGPGIVGGTAGVNWGSFISDLKQVVREQGIGQGDGGLTDISSAARLKMIYDFQTQSAANFARWKIGQSSDALDNFPAQEFFRVESRDNPRNWAPRWDAAFSPFEGATRSSSGRMVALMNNPGWSSLSRFGTPWPPFDYGSGMGVESVDRDDAIALGLLGADDRIESSEADFNDGLEASVEGVPEAFRAKLNEIFGDQVQFKDNKAVWQGNLIGDLYQQALSDKNFKDKIDLGRTWESVVQLAKPYMDIADHKLYLTADDIRKASSSHGDEIRGDQRSLTKLDFEVLPHIWREPDSVTQWTKTQKKPSGKTPYTLEFSKRLIGKTWSVLWQRMPSKVLFLNTLWVEN